MDESGIGNHQIAKNDRLLLLQCLQGLRPASKEMAS
jgi:hypothetical protein